MGPNLPLRGKILLLSQQDEQSMSYQWPIMAMLTNLKKNWGIYCKANVKESRQKLLHGISKVPEHILNEMKPLMGRKETWEVIKTRPNFFVVCRLRVYCGFAAICSTVYNSLTFKSLVQSVVQSMSIYLFRTARSENWGSSARSRTIKLTSWTHYNIFQHIYCTVHNIHVYIYIFTHMYMLCIEIIYLYL